MSIFSQLRTTAGSLFDDYGTAMQLKKITEGAYSVTTGKVVETPSTAYNFYGVISTSPPQSGQKVTPIFDLQAGDVLVIVSDDALSVSIEPRDIIVIDSEEWRVISVDPPYDDDTVVVRTVQVRKGTS